MNTLNLLPRANVEGIRRYAIRQIDALGTDHPDSAYYARMWTAADNELDSGRASVR